METTLLSVSTMSELFSTGLRGDKQQHPSPPTGSLPLIHGGGSPGPRQPNVNTDAWALSPVAKSPNAFGLGMQSPCPEVHPPRLVGYPKASHSHSGD